MTAQAELLGLRFSREWAMANKWTFQIPPIRCLLDRYVGDGRGWADPFAGNNSPAEFTNDHNPETKAHDHELASDWANKLPFGLNGGIFDPPYSPRQVSEHYQEVGGKASQLDTSSNRYTIVQNPLGLRIKPGGIAISCGWNSNGFGLVRGFKVIEILLVAHGANHNDTIVTVERKMQTNLFEAPPQTTPQGETGKA